MDAVDNGVMNTKKCGGLFYKIKMCPFLPLGTCTKGSKCSFAHCASEIIPMNSLKKTVLCKSWQMGECLLSPIECRFAHGKDDLSCLHLYKTAFCKDWLECSGSCPRGDRCHKAHNQDELRPKVAKCPDCSLNISTKPTSVSELILESDSNVITAKKSGFQVDLLQLEELSAQKQVFVKDDHLSFSFNENLNSNYHENDLSIKSVIEKLDEVLNFFLSNEILASTTQDTFHVNNNLDQTKNEILHAVKILQSAAAAVLKPKAKEVSSPKVSTDAPPSISSNSSLINESEKISSSFLASNSAYKTKIPKTSQQFNGNPSHRRGRSILSESVSHLLDFQPSSQPATSTTVLASHSKWLKLNKNRHHDHHDHIDTLEDPLHKEAGRKPGYPLQPPPLTFIENSNKDIHQHIHNSSSLSLHELHSQHTSPSIQTEEERQHLFHFAQIPRNLSTSGIRLQTPVKLLVETANSPSVNSCCELLPSSVFAKSSPAMVEQTTPQACFPSSALPFQQMSMQSINYETPDFYSRSSFMQDKLFDFTQTSTLHHYRHHHINHNFHHYKIIDESTQQQLEYYPHLNPTNLAFPIKIRAPSCCVAEVYKNNFNPSVERDNCRKYHQRYNHHHHHHHQQELRLIDHHLQGLSLFGDSLIEGGGPDSNLTIVAPPKQNEAHIFSQLTNNASSPHRNKFFSNNSSYPTVISSPSPYSQLGNNHHHHIHHSVSTLRHEPLRVQSKILSDDAIKEPSQSSSSSSSCVLSCYTAFLSEMDVLSRPPSSPNGSVLGMDDEYEFERTHIVLNVPPVQPRDNEFTTITTSNINTRRADFVDEINAAQISHSFAPLLNNDVQKFSKVDHSIFVSDSATPISSGHDSKAESVKKTFFFKETADKVREFSFKVTDKENGNDEATYKNRNHVQVQQNNNEAFLLVDNSVPSSLLEIHESVSFVNSPITRCDEVSVSQKLNDSNILQSASSSKEVLSEHPSGFTSSSVIPSMILNSPSLVTASHLFGQQRMNSFEAAVGIDEYQSSTAANIFNNNNYNTNIANPHAYATPHTYWNTYLFAFQGGQNSENHKSLQQFDTVGQDFKFNNNFNKKSHANKHSINIHEAVHNPECLPPSPNSTTPLVPAVPFNYEIAPHYVPNFH